MQNAAFAARRARLGLRARARSRAASSSAVAGSRALGFAGANVTIPHKLAAVALCDEADGESVNTLVFRDGRVLGFNTDREIVAGIEAQRVCLIGAGGAAKALLPGARRGGARLLARRRLAAGCRRRRPDRERDAGAGRAARRAARGPGRRRPRLLPRRPPDRARRGRARGGVRRSSTGSRRSCARARRRSSSGRGSRRRSTAMRAAVGLDAVTLRLDTAGESHGPALVAIVTGLPAGLVLDREAIDADLARRQQGYGRSPRQQLEQDTVEVLAGLRHGRTLGHAAGARRPQPRPQELDVGDEPVAAGGRADRKGTKPVTLPRPGHADLAGALKYGLDDVRNALERASARQTAVAVAAGAVAKALLARDRRSTVAGRVVDGGAASSGSTRRAPTATRSAASSRCARAACRPGSAPTRRGGPARRAARRGADGDPGGEGRRDRRGLRARRAARLGGARRDPRATTARLPRDEPRGRDRGAASRTARRSSCARR